MSCGPCRPRGTEEPAGARRPPSPSRLYRNTERGKICGVCAGFADYFDVNIFIVRLVAVISLFMFTVPTLIAYFVAALLIDKAPAYHYQSDAEKDFWRQVRMKPSESLSRLRHRYREQEQRIRSMEAFVTSSEAKLHRAFRDLEG